MEIPAVRDRVPLPPARLTIVLTFTVAILSILTGIANIGAQSLVGAFAEVVPREVQRAAGFTGTLTGFVMLAGAFGLRHRQRVAWYLTLVLLPVTAIQGLIQSSPLSIPLVLLSLVSIPTVIASRSRFTRAIDVSTSQLAAGTALIGVMIYGTVGGFALRDEFAGIDTVLDAFYFTIVTASTVGYGDVTGTTQTARLFALSLVVVGTASFAVALGALLGPAIQAHFAAALGRMNERNLDLMEEHVIVLGYGELTEQILSQLATETDFVAIVPDGDVVADLVDRGYDAIVGDPSDEETLDRAGIESAAAALVATESDGDDALSVLTARQLNPDVRIVAAATNSENVDKLRRAGADVVISPTVIGSYLLFESLMGRGSGEDLSDLIVGEVATVESEKSGDGDD